jgi:hypothetical protein
MDILIIDNKTYCLNCMKETDCMKYCNDDCRNQYRNLMRRKHGSNAKPCPVCGKMFVETNVKKRCSRTCTEKMWRRNKKQAEQLPLIAPVKKNCNCGNFQRCMICRNAEKRRAWKANDIAVFRLHVIEQITGAREAG